MVARGFSSETFCFEAVEEAAEYERPYHVCYLGDFDRSGRDAAEALQHIVTEERKRHAEERCRLIALPTAPERRPWWRRWFR